MPQQQSSMPSRRSVAKGAAWATPILTFPTVAPAFAASAIALNSDLQVSRDINIVNPVTYRIGNAGPDATSQQVTWALEIVQTGGKTGADSVRFTTIDNDAGTRFILGAPTYSTNASGFKVTSQTLTLVKGFSPGLLSGDVWLRIRIRFPLTTNVFNDNYQARWTVTFAPYGFTDINPGNTGATFNEGPIVA